MIQAREVASMEEEKEQSQESPEEKPEEQPAEPTAEQPPAPEAAQPPVEPVQPPPPPPEDTTVYVILGFVCAALGLVCSPFCSVVALVFPIVGIVLGVVVNRKNNPIGTWIIVASVVTLVIGIGLSAIGLVFLKNAMRGTEPWRM
jgi:hypothetical protein